MAIRNTTLITKHSDVVNRPLPSSLLAGEAIVNTAEGILLFSGVTSSTNEWTPAGTGTTANFFEVGSNLYDLRLRNKITKYQGQSGSDLVGKFLSGSTEGFVLADITSIGGISDFTYDSSLNRFRITQTNNNTFDAFITQVSGLTINGNLSVTGTETVNQLTITGTSVYNLNATGANAFELINYGTLSAFTVQNDVYVSGATYNGATDNTNVTTFNLAYAGNLKTGPHSLTGTDTFVTGGTYNNSNALITFRKNNGSNFSVDLSTLDLNDTHSTGGTITNVISTSNNQQSIQIVGNQNFTPFTITGLTDTFVTGGTYNNNAANITFNRNNGSNFSVDLSTLDLNDTHSTGGTITNVISNNNNQQSIQIVGNDNFTPFTVTGLTDTFITGGTYNNSTANITFNRNNGSNFNVNLSALDLNDTFVTGITYNSSTNTITLFRNEGEPNLTTSINQFSGITLNNLTAGRVVYVGTSGLLKDESGFEYNEGTNTFTVGNIFVNNPSGTTANIGQGGLEIGSGGSTATPGIGNLVVHGDLTVFGTETIISTTDLYVEDPQIELNYNPTGSTVVTSIGSGIRIQDGGGIQGQDVKIGIGQLQGSSISGSTAEYTATTGFSNRGWITQLNDIVIRATSPINFGDPTGVRVLAEGDSLDGGTY
jgi:hypothetical protein